MKMICFAIVAGIPALVSCGQEPGQCYVRNHSDTDVDSVVVSYAGQKIVVTAITAHTSVQQPIPGLAGPAANSLPLVATGFVDGKKFSVAIPAREQRNMFRRLQIDIEEPLDARLTSH
ncbi:MAG: hypothetical protein EOP50_05730 [Sphingobacteriales bacterium]|nr:MAG: hypothetical protein EOP50_05730 [Sphingobacteriales bacterium]